MTTDMRTTRDEQPRWTNEAALRKQAIKRSWICPGAGFALVGKGTWAVATFVASLGSVLAVAWLALQPAAVSFWIAFVVVVVAAALWLVEQVAVKKTALRSPGPSILDRGWIASGLVAWLGVILAVGIVVTSLGSLQMAGGAMAPTIENEQRLIYHKRVDRQSLQPGAIVVFSNSDDSAWGQPGWMVVSRILAAPGDDIFIEDGHYVVNGKAGPPVAVGGRYPIVLEIPSSPEPLRVPADCYFVVPDSPAKGLDSRVLSWARADKIVSSRLWYFGGRHLWKPVE